MRVRAACALRCHSNRLRQKLIQVELGVRLVFDQRSEAPSAHVAADLARRSG